MKNEYSNGRLSYFFRPRIHGNVFAWNEPASKSKTSKQVTENIMRWEDDGGPVSERGTILPQVAETNTPRLMDVAGKALLYDEIGRNGEGNFQEQNPRS